VSVKKFTGFCRATVRPIRSTSLVPTMFSRVAILSLTELAPGEPLLLPWRSFPVRRPCKIFRVAEGQSRRKSQLGERFLHLILLSALCSALSAHMYWNHTRFTSEKFLFTSSLPETTSPCPGSRCSTSRLDKRLMLSFKASPSPPGRSVLPIPW